jgi:hypothetical protein
LTVPTAIENLAAFAGYSAQSISNYTFDDTASIARTLSTDTGDFCGEKQLFFTLNGNPTTFLTAQNSNFIYFNPPVDSKDLGVT